MKSTLRWPFAIGVLWLTATAGAPAVYAQREANQRPKLSLKAQPNVGISPVRIVLTAELAGGANDYQEFYCPTVLWDWADGTESESTFDCEPYEAGKTAIKRRFTIQHIFKAAGSHKVWVRLKRNDKLLASANVTIQVQPGRGIEDDR